MKYWMVIVLVTWCMGRSEAQQVRGALVGEKWPICFKRTEAPLGFSVAYTHRDYKIKNRNAWLYMAIRGDRPDELPAYQEIDVLHLNNKYKMDVIRFQPDLWIFPFLNVYAFGGKVYADSKYNYALKVPAWGKKLAYKDNSRGWEYGGGIKLEYFVRHFRPQLDYSLYWTDFDEVNDHLKTQELNFSLGYQVNLNKTWLSHVVVRLGAAYHQVQFNNRYGRMIVPEEDMLKTNQDALLWTSLIARIHNIDVEYQIDKLWFATAEDQQNFSDLLKRIEKNGVDVTDFPYHEAEMKDYKRWNITLAIEINLNRHLTLGFNSDFLENHSMYSFILGYRLLGKK